MGIQAATAMKSLIMAKQAVKLFILRKRQGTVKEKIKAAQVCYRDDF
jgi:hypothetical protein